MGAVATDDLSMGKTILIATDGSAEAREAVAYGLELAAERGAGAILLQIIPSVGRSIRNGEAFIRPIPDEIARRRGPGLADADVLAVRYGVPVSFEVLAGDPADEIVTYADNHDVDVIVVGASGSARPGNVSAAVLHDAHRPVLVVQGTTLQAAV